MGDERVFGLLGERLGHSYSPVIYRELAGLDYRLFERAPGEVERFVRDGAWTGMNVTIPYKRTVVPLMDELTPEARRMGNVNTMLRRPDGTLLGHNTDCRGFELLVGSVGCDVEGATALLLGASGGAGATCRTVLEDMGARVVGAGRAAGKPGVDVTYDELPAWKGLGDVRLLVNATPVGMYPDCPASPVALELFPALEGVVDIVYNPARTQLVLDAQRRGIPCAGGLIMLVGQAAAAIELYTGERVSAERVRDLTDRLSASQLNVALIGMPGSGKTRVGQALAEMLGREHVDIDREIERRVGRPCSEYIHAMGEDAFREQETATLAEVARESRLVVSCGGGVVERPENLDLLRQNSTVVMLDRKLEELSSKGRPISQRDGIAALAKKRLPLYRSWADIVVSSRSCARETACDVALELPPAL